MNMDEIPRISHSFRYCIVCGVLFLLLAFRLSLYELPDELPPVPVLGCCLDVKAVFFTFARSFSFNFRYRGLFEDVWLMMLPSRILLFLFC
jgi:hypothetical protein